MNTIKQHPKNKVFQKITLGKSVYTRKVILPCQCTGEPTTKVRPKTYRDVITNLDVGTVALRHLLEFTREIETVWSLQVTQSKILSCVKRK